MYRKFYENVTRIGGQFEYLQDILEKISQLPEFVKNEDLEAYLPWNWQKNKRQEII
ncbi:hypothetical protein LB941_11875 [Ligilactobacillus sp. WILCCON 0076]|uniref:Transposase IS66 C-terminal domain-containing protein n=1 Tax=Ligilactobacillus ubinensis TaxID=2876789 RepID=A0A9X2JMF4_9LACO|nr:hypothetical protein [Ligilactobacillus ubinensis]MCP0888027.1 hypothetical protein [Ligilactobacillus ubinensis]